MNTTEKAGKAKAVGKSAKLADALSDSMTAADDKLETRFAKADAAMEASGGVLLRHQSNQRGAQEAPPAAPSSLDGDHDDEIFDADIDHVHDNDENSRQTFPDEDIADLVDSIRDVGQKEPAVAMPHPDRPGEWMLLSGHKRKRALVKAGIRRIKLRRHGQVFGLERYKVSRTLNKHTAETALDQALIWKILLDKGHASTIDEIAKAEGYKNRSIVSKTLAFLKLPPAALTRIGQHPREFGAAAGQLLSQIAEQVPEMELIQVIDDVVAGKTTVRKLEAIVERLAAGGGNARRAKRNSRQYKLQVEGAEVGVLKDWDDGRVLLEIKLDDQKRRETLVELLKRQFEAG